jgi:hypothetical protein
MRLRTPQYPILDSPHVDLRLERLELVALLEVVIECDDGARHHQANVGRRRRGTERGGGSSTVASY